MSWGLKIRRGIGWLGDALRFPGAMLYWNWRKDRFVRRGRRDRCPCQNESDDSVPGRVRCDAILHWHDPARFQKICPLLVETPEGWRCSVHVSAVRPFWGRVAQWLAWAVIALYLTTATVAWVGLRTASRAPIGWLQVAWPGKWHEIKSVQSAHLFRQALESFAAGKVAEAHLRLETAQALDPGNYDIALMLAQISMFQGSYHFSDELFMQLWRAHPAHGSRTAVTYHDTLLSLDRMGKLAAFSVAMARADSARAAVWVRSALLAVRSMPAAEAAAFGEKQAAAIGALAPHAQMLLQAELHLRAGDEIGALAKLHHRFEGPFNATYTRYQIERVADLGPVSHAQLLLGALGGLLGDFDQQLVQTALALQDHDQVLARGTFRSVLRMPLTLARVERLAGLLIAHPDATLYRDLTERLRMDATLEAAVDGPTLWVTGLVCGLPDEARHWQQHGHQPPFAHYPAIAALNFSSRNLLEPGSIGHLVNTLTLPRDIVLALLWRVTPQRPARNSDGR